MNNRTDLGYLTVEVDFHRVAACPWCGSGQIEQIATRGDGLPVDRCGECHLGFLGSLPDDLAVFYDESYYVRSPIPGTKPAVSGYEDYDRAYTPSSFRWLTSMITAIRPERGRLFDFGAARGTFLDMARRDGFEVAGVELTGEGASAACAKGLDVRQGFFDPSDWTEGSFDVVTALEVLEHVTDIRSTMQGLGQILADDGILVFFVPNVTDEIISAYGNDALDFNKSYDHTLFLNPEILRTICDEIFGAGSLTLFTADVEQWGQSVSSALGIVRKQSHGPRPEAQLIDVLTGRRSVDQVENAAEAVALALMGAKFFEPDLADQAVSKARSLGATDTELVTVEAQILRNRGELFRAIGLLERRVLEDLTNSDPLAAQLMLEVFDDITNMMEIPEPGVATGLERIHDRAVASSALRDAIRQSRSHDTHEERSWTDPQWVENTALALTTYENRLFEAEVAARDFEYLFEESELDRLAATAKATDLERRAATYEQRLYDIHNSRMWKLQTQVWKTKALVNRTPAQDADTLDAEQLDEQHKHTTGSNPPRPRVFPVTVSVIMPVYNKGETIRDSIESIRRQTFSDIEVVVWDDGSTDEETIAVLDEIAAIPDVFVTRAENQGVVEARNAAMAAAQGEFLVCLDPDDRFAPTYIEKAVLFLRAHPDISLVYPWQHTFGDKAEVWKTHDLDPVRITEVNHVPVCAMFRREVFEETGGFSPEMTGGYEDWEFWAHAAALGFQGRAIPEPLFEYRYSSDPTKSRDAEARKLKAELSELIRSRHAKPSSAESPTEWLEPPRRIRQSPPTFPTGTGTPVVIMVPWFTVGGADNVVESLVRHWVDSGRIVVVIATLGVGKDMHDRIDELLDITPYVYELPNYLRRHLWYPFVRSIVSALPKPTILNIGSTWFYENARRLKADRPNVRIVDQQFNDSGHLVGNRNARDAIDVTITAYKGLNSLIEKQGNPATTTVYVGIDPLPVTSAEATRATTDLGLGPETSFAVFLGRLSEEKRPEWLLPLADALGQSGKTLVVVGRGPRTKKLGKAFKKHPAIIWKKKVDNAYALLAASSVTVLPSRIEGIPLTAMESLAVGTPVVATAVGGLPELSDVAGVHLVKPDDQNAFIDEVMRTLSAAPVQRISLPKWLGVRQMLDRYDSIVG